MSFAKRYSQMNADQFKRLKICIDLIKSIRGQSISIELNLNIFCQEIHQREVGLNKALEKN